jgi:Helicase conserved C-terminal domain
LIEDAKKVTTRQDGKLNRTLQALPELLKRHPKAPRVLIFTRYKDTLDYLVKALEREADKEGTLKGLTVFSIYGDMNQKARRETYRTFENTEKAVCVATDCISEGLDLQRACAELIHYELPWNPNRLEQRNGRLDRYGQPEAKVGILTLVREDPLDITMLKVLVEKARRIRDDYGFCPVIFSSARELKRLIRQFGQTQQAFLPGFDLNEVLPGAAVDDDLEATEKERLAKIVDESFYGQEQIRLPEVEQALQQTYRTVGAPDEIRGFVLSALNQFNVRAVQQPDETWKLDLRGTLFNDLDDELHITFDPKIARDDPDLDLLDLAHPLVRRLVESVQHSLAGTEGGRIAARGSSAIKEVTAVVYLLARFVTASEPPVLMEELIPLAFNPYGNKPVEADPVALFQARAQPLTWTQADMKDAATDALNASDLGILINQAVEQRRERLAERQSEIARLTSEWTRGMDDVRVASKDLLTVTLLIPHG